MSNSEMQQAEQLAQAILQRAAALATEHSVHARQTAARLHTESRTRLHYWRERETIAAKHEAERMYRRLVQAGELRMQADLDRMRWHLAHTVMQRLQVELAHFVANSPEYQPFLRELVRVSAAAIERDALIAEVSQRDCDALVPHLAKLADGKQIELLPRHDDTWSGGVLMYSQDRRIRIDNTLHGRLQQRHNDIYQAVLAQLFPEVVYHTSA
jgi:V/A-type H+/Na+-transporting ATPase subunit E